MNRFLRLVLMMVAVVSCRGMALADLYVTEYMKGEVLKVNADGTRTVFASGFYHPTAIAFGPDGYLYVGQDNVAGDPGQGNIFRLDSTGGKTLFADVSQVRGFAFDASGNLYVGQENPQCITRISRNGLTQTTVASGFCAQGLAFDASGNLYAATGGYGDNRIMKIATDGTVSTFAYVHANPIALAFGLDGTLLATESDTSYPLPSIATIQNDGSIGSRQFFGPPGWGEMADGLAVTGDGYLYANFNDAIYKLDAALNPVGPAITGFDYIWGMAETSAPIPGSAAVPEPASVVCGIIGLGMIGAWIKKHRAA
jgi:sugar lactone lactonase YvrE